MKTLAIHLGHDTSIALYDGFRQVFISKEERLNRIKNFDSRGELPHLSIKKLQSEFDLSGVEALAMTRTFMPGRYYKFEPVRKRIYRTVKEFLTGDALGYEVPSRMRKYQRREEDLLKLDKLKSELGVPANIPVFFTNHHYAHALPVIFYKPEWDHGLIYTADGGGDMDHYGIFHFDRNSLQTIYGGDVHIYKKDHSEGRHSLGQMYCVITEIAGFKRNRHEGKITGLAAFGKPSVLEKMRKHYFVREDGVIRSRFASYKEMEEYLWKLSKHCSIEDLSASGQKLLEDLFVESVQTLQRNRDFRNLGLCGGVFSNVRLNQVLSELPGIEDVFVFPPMGDEGLVIGACLDVYLRKHGWNTFLQNRHELGMVYWGETYDSFKPYLHKGDFRVIARGDVISKTAELLQEGKVCALFTGGMEYGPRALGARSILINPADESINDSVNRRLERTEFMPFAPVVRLERAGEVFELTPSNLKPMKYMTITCGVKPEWRGEIPGVVHIDGTARPQIISRSDNPLYYDILHQFEQITGLPCLVNTSFNAHEEPIINTPKEALNALRQDRIDYLVTDDLILERD